MRLYELKVATPQDLTPKVANANITPNKLQHDMLPKGSKRIGTHSAYGTVHYSERDPGSVTKIVARDELEKDAYFQYVSQMTKNDRIANNPWFPKIYKVEVVKQPDRPTHHYKVEMEKLQPFNTLSAEEINMLGDRCFFGWSAMVRDALARKKKQASRGEAAGMTKSDHAVLSYALLTGIDQIISGNSKGKSKFSQQEDKTITYIKDPNLRGAILILRKLLKQADTAGYDRLSDVHDENIMVRRTPGGPQLVLTDPVSG